MTPPPINQNDIADIASKLSESLEKHLAQASAAHANRGPGNVEAAQLSALLNLVCLRMAKLGVTDQDAVNALIASLRGIRKHLKQAAKG